MGVAIRKGAPKPDLVTTAGLQAALLNAKRSPTAKAALTGIYIKGLFERLGIAEELKSKIRLGRGAEMVGEGKAEIGITQISEILPVAGADSPARCRRRFSRTPYFRRPSVHARPRADAGRALLKYPEIARRR